VLGGEGADVVDLLLGRGWKWFQRVGHPQVPGYFGCDFFEVHPREKGFQVHLLGLPIEAEDGLEEGDAKRGTFVQKLPNGLPFNSSDFLAPQGKRAGNTRIRNPKVARHLRPRIPMIHYRKPR
jgi:hypothetical protein